MLLDSRAAFHPVFHDGVWFSWLDGTILLTLVASLGVMDIIVVWTLTGLLIAVKVPILDGATLSLTRKRGSYYSRVRALGSGTLYNYVGVQGYWLMVAMCVAGMLLVIASYSTRLDDDFPM